MGKMGKLWACLAAASAAMSPAAGAAAQAPAPAHAAGQSDGLDALFEAAARGETEPLERALASEADAELRVLLAVRLAMARGDFAAAADPALERLAGSDIPERRRAALSILAGLAFLRGDYAEAARAGQLLERALIEAGDTHGATATAQMHRLAALLVGQPAMRVEGAVAAGSTPARYDRVGLPRIDVAVNGQAQEAVFDTGAAMSVLSAETARRLGVEVLGAPTDIGNGVQGTVAVRIGIADRVEVAGTVLRHVPFLIIDDAQLTFPQVPGGYDIRAIFGLPEMRALGRVRLEQSGRLSVLPAGEAQPGPANLVIAGNAVYAGVELDGRLWPLLLDTGANQTALTALYAAAMPASVARLETSVAGSASAGGARRQQVATWRDAPLTIAGHSLILPALPIALPAAEGPPARHYGTLGSNALRAFASYTLDFAAMRLELGEPVAAQPAPQR